MSTRSRTGRVPLPQTPHPGDAPASRRRVLAAGAGAVLAVTAPAGCGLFDDEPEPLPEPDPLQPVLDEALALATAHERAAAADPALAVRLAPLARDHRAHAVELARVIGTAPGSAAPGSAALGSAAPGSAAPGASAAPVAQTVAELRSAEQAAARTATAAARTTPPDRAGLVGSIAACRATHAEALR